MHSIRRNINIHVITSMAIIVIGILYGLIFTQGYPKIYIDQKSLYGVNNGNLKDFKVEDDGLLESETDDPWVTYSLDEAVPVAYIQINASNVKDMGGRLHIFDTDSWKDKSGLLKNGSNGYYLFSDSDIWVTQNYRFDFVEVDKAACRINNITINPLIPVFLIGFVRATIPLVIIYILSYILFTIASKHKNNTNSKISPDHILFMLIASAVISYFVMLNLRIIVNSTNWIIVTTALFALFLIKLPDLNRKSTKILVLLFSLLLSLANSLGSHVVVGQEPYSDLMNTSYVEPYNWKDIVEIIIMMAVIYKCILAIFYLILNLKDRTIKCRIMFVKEVIFIVPMVCMLICWIPYFVLYYPGFILGDSVNQINQAIGTLKLSNHHPVFHTLLIRLCIKIGELYGGLTFGCAIYTILQMLYISFAIGKSVEWLSHHHVPFVLICIITGAYAVIPYFGQTSIAMWKDPAFGASIVLLTISMMDYFSIITNSTTKSKRHNKYLFFTTVFALLTCLFRNNGIYALVFSCFITLIIAIRRKKIRRPLIQLAANLAAVCCIFFLITGPVYNYFEILPSEKVESFGVCINQMASVAASDDGIMSNEEREFMNDMLPIAKYKETYRPCAVDLLKWDSNFNSNCLNYHNFIKIYVSMGLKNPIKYMNAWALMTFGYWAPNRWELNNDSLNLIKGNFGDILASGLPMRIMDMTALPNNILYKIFTVYGDVISLGTVDWILIFSALVMLLTRDTKGIVSICPSVGVVITLIIASPYWYWQRYGMAQYYLLPIYFYLIISNIKAPAKLFMKEENNG